MKSRPLVTAVMITGMHESRYDMARIALQCFHQQTHPERELVIVNHGPISISDGASNVREFRVIKSEKETVGDLRNFGLEQARGEFVIAWDDDDWYSPKRMETQLAAQQGGAAVVLKNQIRCNLLTGSALCGREEGGHHGSILHPCYVPFRYPSLVRNSDTEFMKSFKQVTVLDNDPSIYVRFYHGLNLWDAKHIMRQLADPDIRDQMELPPSQARMLRGILAEHARVYRKFRNNPRTPTD